LGAEYYFGHQWSTVLDVGPAWISIEDDDTAQSVNGVEGVIKPRYQLSFGKACPNEEMAPAFSLILSSIFISGQASAGIEFEWRPP